MDLARIKDSVSENDKTGILLRSLPSSLGFIALMEDAHKMDYDSIFGLIRSELERLKSHDKTNTTKINQILMPVELTYFHQDIRTYDELTVIILNVGIVTRMVTQRMNGG